VPRNCHNFPLTEPKCKCLGIKESSSHVELEKIPKKFETKNARGLTTGQPVNLEILFWTIFDQKSHHLKKIFLENKTIGISKMFTIGS
jgi:hypothetical protein